MPALLDSIEIETAANPQASVIWLHGLGADGNDFVPVLGELDLPQRPIRFLFPHAPMQPVTINGGYIMRAWYDVLSSDFAQRTDERGVRASQAAVVALIEREKERGISAERIVLAGFSQGGAVCLHTGLRYPERLGGIMALSTYLPIAEALGAEMHAANRGISIFMAHGYADPVIPFSAAQRSRDILLAQGYTVEWHEYPMAHSVCTEELAHIGAWLNKILS